VVECLRVFDHAGFFCGFDPTLKEESTVGLILLIVLVVLLMGGLPRWDYSRNWGYGPSGGLGLLLVVVLVLMFVGYVPRGF
jgi:hypothetical protein